MIVPEITPVAGAMARPGGRPVADQVRRSPSGSVAGAASDTAAPSASVRSAEILVEDRGMVVDDLDGLVLATVVDRDGGARLPGHLVDEEDPPAGGGRAHSPGVALGVEGQAAWVEVVQLAVTEGLVPGSRVDRGQPDGPRSAGLRGERVQQPRGGIEGDVVVLLLGHLSPDDQVVAAAEGSGHSGPGDRVHPEQHVLVADDAVHRIEGARGRVEGDAVHRGEGDGALGPRSRAEGAAERR